MLNKSTIKPRPFLPGQQRHIIIIVALALIFFINTGSFAEIFQPLQIILPGNFRGQATELATDLHVTPALCWRVPETIRGLQKNRDVNTLIFATGNDSSIFSPLSFLSAGAIERDLINSLNPDAASLSPDDIEVLAGQTLPADLKQRIWTNVESASGQLIFNSHGKKAIGSKKLWFFNFISKDYCSNLPFDKLGEFDIDEPSRALRRLEFAVASQDYTITTAYLNNKDLNSLIGQLKQLKGYHFLIHLPHGSEKPRFSVIYGEVEENIFKMSLRPGHAVLPVLNIFSKNHGAPRMTLRMLPLAKSPATVAETMVQAAKARLAARTNETLRLIKTIHQASTSSYHFRQQVHAQIVQNQTGCDLTFLLAPSMENFNDNVICTGQLLASFNNDRIRRIRVQGQELLGLFEKLIKGPKAQSFVFAGCAVTYLAGKITSFRIGGQALDLKQQYLCATSESSLQDKVFNDFGSNHALEMPDGQTLWQLWQNGLKSLRIEDKLLIDD